MSFPAKKHLDHWLKKLVNAKLSKWRKQSVAQCWQYGFKWLKSTIWLPQQKRPAIFSSIQKWNLWPGENTMPCFFFLFFFSWGNFLPADFRLEFKDFFFGAGHDARYGDVLSTSLGFFTWFLVAWWLKSFLAGSQVMSVVAQMAELTFCQRFSPNPWVSFAPGYPGWLLVDPPAASRSVSLPNAWKNWRQRHPAPRNAVGFWI